MHYILIKEKIMASKKDVCKDNGDKAQYRALGELFEDIKSGKAKDTSNLPKPLDAETLKRLSEMAAYLHASGPKTGPK